MKWCEFSLFFSWEKKKKQKQNLRNIFICIIKIRIVHAFITYVPFGVGKVCSNDPTTARLQERMEHTRYRFRDNILKAEPC